MTFIKNRLFLIFIAVVAILIAGGYLFGIFCWGKNCTNTSNEKTALQVNQPVSNPKPEMKVNDLVINDVPGTGLLVSTPATGPEALTLFLLIPAGVLGWSIRKYSMEGNKTNN